MDRLLRYSSIVFLMTLFVGVSPIARSATISLAPSSQSVGIGQSFVMTLELAGAGQIVTAYDVTIGFDPSLVAFNVRTPLNALGVPVLETIPSLIVGTDTVSIGEVSLLDDLSIPSQGDPLLLFTIEFTALGKGLASFTLTAPGPFAGETPLGEPFPNAITIDTANGASVDIFAVPEPGTMALVASGFAALLLWRRIAKSPGVL